MKKLALLPLLVLPLSFNVTAADSGVYIEAFTGHSDSLGNPDRDTRTAGASNNGLIEDIELDDDTVAGIKLGYRFNTNWRIDLSYFNSERDNDWRTEFPGGASSYFNSSMKSEVYMLSVYYQTRVNNWLLPYVSAGIGNSKNKLTNIEEKFTENGAVGAYVNSNSENSLAYKLGVGADIQLSNNVYLNVDYSAYYLGDMSSDNSRNFVSPSSNQSIGAYKFDNVWVDVYSLGLRYQF
ncbi:outer membrane protein [Methylophaga sp.]|uniref:outer membrane protein n=1 Tax=Methylophaga sp. TaxID=2024840 RepID=UPI003A8EFCCE